MQTTRVLGPKIRCYRRNDDMPSAQLITDERRRQTVRRPIDDVCRRRSRRAETTESIIVFSASI